MRKWVDNSGWLIMSVAATVMVCLLAAAEQGLLAVAFLVFLGIVIAVVTNLESVRYREGWDDACSALELVEDDWDA